MLSARAYSFRQKSKLAISLSWIGGYANVVFFLAAAAFVSHMTGNATQFGVAISQLNTSHLAHFGFLLLCFWLGAVSSAVMTESAMRGGVRSKYVLSMAAEGALLALLGLLMLRDSAGPETLAFIASFTLGLQNATITEISGAVIRTTHLTGVITDLGLESVRLLRKSTANPRRLALLFCVFWSFIIGAAAGAWMYVHFRSICMIPPVASIGWIIWMDLRKPVAGVKELDVLSFAPTASSRRYSRRSWGSIVSTTTAAIAPSIHRISISGCSTCRIAGAW